jgi:hypothetical protein
MRIIAFIQDEHSMKDIMKSQGIPDFFIRRSLGVVGQAPPPIPKFIDTTFVRRSAKEERLSMNSPATTLLSHLW